MPHTLPCCHAAHTQTARKRLRISPLPHHCTHTAASGHSQRCLSAQVHRFGGCRGKPRARSRQAVADPDDPGSFDRDDIDIDQLAKQLSTEARRMRDSMSGSMSEDELTGEARQEAVESSASPKPEARRGPFGWETTPAGTTVVESLGDGGFSSDDFEVQQQLGQLSWVTERPQDSPLQLSRPASAARTAILLFLARYFSRQAYQGAVTVLLKEFLPGASAVAVNEVQIMTHLQQLPHNSWQAAHAPISAQPPFVPLLGYFCSAPSQQGRRLMAAMAEENNNSREQAVWLVYKWEALQPLSHYAAAQQSPRAGGILARAGLWGSREDAQQAALSARCTMVRSIARGAVAALAHCHEHDVVHGSLGAGSLLLNTFDDHRAHDVVVKLDNFGFARHYSPADTIGTQATSPLFPAPFPLGMDNPSALGQREDLQALGLVILELVFAALAEGNTASGAQLQRLLLDVFAADTHAFRKYCINEVDWAVPTILLDEFDGAGWQLIRDLITGSRSAKELQQNAFCCL